jgi:hypothetical protein
MLVAAYMKQLGGAVSKPTAKQHLAAIRVLFDSPVTGQVVPVNPVSAVNRHHRLPRQRRYDRARPADRGPRVAAHDEALRPHWRRGEPGRDRADRDLKPVGIPPLQRDCPA